MRAGVRLVQTAPSSSNAVREGQKIVSSNETRVIHSPLMARLVFRTVFRPTYPAKFIMGMHRTPPCHPLFLICQRLSPRDYDKIATRIGVRRVVRSLDRSKRTAKRTLLSVIDNERGGDDAFKRVLCPLLFNEDPIRVVMGADLYRS